MAHVFQFYLDDVYIGNSSSGVYTVTVTADGAYTCVPVNTVGKEENATVVISTVDAPSVKVNPTSSVVVEGHNITLNCMASGRPEPVLSWTKVGESGQVLSENPSLILSNVRRPGTLDNMIQYQCTAENGVENPAFAIANITVHYGPSGTTIELTPSNTTVLRGSSLSINCTTDANPMAHVFEFYLDDVYIGNSSSGVYTVTVTADGAYTCVPVNTVGKEENATVVISTVDAPSVKVHPTSSVVVEGHNITLNCVATGRPEPVLSWTKVGESSQVLSENSSLILSNVCRPGTLDNTIQYQCTAENGVENPAFAIANITIHYGPSGTDIELTPSNTTVVRGSSLSINCTTDANPVAHVFQFYLDDVYIGNSSSGVFNVTVTADGAYTCVPVNTVGKEGNATVVISTVDAPSVKVSPTSSVVVEGHNITLNCVASGRPEPVLSWIKVGESGQVLSENSSLILSNVRRPGTLDNMVQYQCTAENGVENPAFVIANITVHYGPSGTAIELTPSNTTVLRGSSLSINCSTDSNPMAHVFQFYLDDIYIGNSTSGVYNVTVTADGAYTCVPVNTVGKEQNATVVIRTVDAPSVNVHPTSSVVVEGHNITLNCVASGRPEPVLSWTKVGESGQVVSENPSLILSNVRRPGTLDNMIQYQCTAENGVENPAFAIANITVHYEPTVSLQQCPSHIIEGNDAVLFCNATGNPVPKVVWVELQTGAILNSSENLMLKTIKRNQAGGYQCHAFNGIGRNSTKTCYLDVFYGPNGTTIELTPSNTTVLRGSSLSLNCSTHANPMAHVFKFYLDDVYIGNSSSGVFNVTVTTDGAYTCVPVNTVGREENTTVVISTVDAPSVKVSPTSSVVVEGHSITLSCMASGIPEPVLSWTKVGESSQVLSENSSLILSNVRRPGTLDNMIQYQCTAENGVENPAFAIANITVHYGPSGTTVELTPSNTTVLRGSALSLNCTTDANPMAHVFQFYLDDIYIGNSTSGVYNVTVTADGAYTCVPVNTVGKEQNATVVISTVDAPSVKVHPTSLIVVEGHNITLNCVASGRPEPVLSWIKVGESGQVLSENSSLILSNVRRPGTLDNMIQYQCTAENGVENPAFAIANITVHYRPSGTTIELTPSNTTILRDSSLSINCTTDANPVAHVFQFYLDDVYIGNSSSGVYNVTVTADGAYTCVPVNTVGKEENATVVISTVDAPSVKVHPASSVVVEGNNITLNCMASGKPQPVLSWTKVFESGQVLSENSSLVFPNVRRPGTLDNMIQYQCTAENGVENPAFAIANITVHYEPTVSLQQCPSHIVEGNDVVLFCNATGNPVPKVAWVELQTGAILNNSESLMLKTIDRNQAGGYQCHGFNGIGRNSTKTCYLDVFYGPSGTTIELTPSNTTVLHGSSLSINCSTHANPMAHVFQFFLDDVYIGNSSSGVFNVTVTTDGAYSCVPVNTVGKEENATVVISTVDAPSVEVHPTFSVVVEGNNITLSCMASGRPEPVLSWTKVGESGQVLSGNPFLILSNVRRPGTLDNMIQYQCTAENGVENPAFAIANITVHYGPSGTTVELTPSSTTVLRGSALSLNCTTDANPMAHVFQFYLDDVYIGNSSSGVYNVTVTADGAYTCVPVNTVGKEENATVVISTVDAPSVKVHPTSSVVVEGHNITLNCVASGRPEPVLSWTKVGESSQVLSENSSLILSNVRRPGTLDNMIQYQCTAENGVENPAFAIANITVHYGPSGTNMELTPSNTTVLRDSSLSINCTTDANPMAHVFQFYLDDACIGNSSSGVFTVTVAADGAYTCVPVNTVGKEENATVVIRTVDAPSVKVRPTSLIVVEGNNITLNCMASGRPEPVLSWTKVGESSQVLSTNSSLILSNVRRPGTLNNMIQYQCTAENGVQNPAFAIANITVHYGPSGTRMELSPSNRTVLRGSSLSIKCSTDANPMAHVFQFYLDDVYIGNSSSGVYNVTVTADGAYTCVPVNTVGKEQNATVVISTVDAPFVKVHPTSSFVVEGNNITLNCMASGRPEPVLSWTKVGESGQVLSENSSLIISNIRRPGTLDNTIQYQCTAENGVENPAFAIAKITVHYAPEIVFSSPDNLKAVEGSGAEMFCNATGNPKPNITWTKRGNSTVLSTSENLKLTKLKREESGAVFNCIVHNHHGSSETSVTISVLYKSAVTLQQCPTPVLEGSSATLYCNATGNPAPSIAWIRAGTGKVVSRSGRLHIAVINRNESDLYECHAWNGIGNNDNESCTIDVQYSPEILTAPSAEVVVEGGSLRLFCNATGNPQPIITWKKQDNMTILSVSNTLRLTGLTRKDDGSVFSCKAQNDLGSTEANATLTVWYPPKIIVAPSPQQVVEGRGVSLFCNATGNPKPNITWTKNGNSSVLSTSEMLNISRLAWKDDGGIIKCKVQNNQGSEEATAEITLWYPSAINAVPDNYTVLEGNNVTLYCNSTGKPAPNITWTKDGNSTILHQGEEFIINNIHRDASGDYTCTAWNGVGEPQNEIATIAVLYPPTILSAPNNQTVLEYSDVSFFCHATGNPQPRIIWTQQNSTTVLHQGNTFTIPNVTRDYNGKGYQCTAQNNVTQDARAYASLSVHYPPEVTVLSSNINVREGENVSLDCLPTGNPIPDVTWIRNSDKSVVAKGKRAVFPMISRTDSGLFYCLAWNGVGNNASGNVRINVLYAAEIVSHPVDQVVWVGQQITLSCGAIGNPVPNITYSIVGDNGTVSFGRTLVIGASNISYVKSYTCTADNGLEAPVLANVTVTVLVRPCSANPCFKGNCTDIQGTTYNCTCGYGYKGKNCDEPTQANTFVIEGEITLDRTKFQYHEDYKNHSSARFLNLSTTFIQNVAAIYGDEPQFGHVRVNNILNGSVVVNFTVFFISGVKTPGRIVEAFNDAVNNGSVALLSVEKGTLRLILPPTSPPSTTIQTSHPSGTSRRDRFLNGWMIALLVVIGCLVMLALVCAILHFCERKKINKQNKEISHRCESGKGNGLHTNDKTPRERAITRPGEYVKEGPTVMELTDQNKGVNERSPDEALGVRFSNGISEMSNGAVTSKL
ncbi:hemicentin-1-like isoform X2 [Montipora foliosa]|uniref:hemicentin-1-like isoform X2 n=1 Tax=Montipora foliosa TaxID=591990 RepID=UPI0035F13ADC